MAQARWRTWPWGPRMMPTLLRRTACMHRVRRTAALSGQGHRPGQYRSRLAGAGRRRPTPSRAACPRLTCGPVTSWALNGCRPPVRFSIRSPSACWWATGARLVDESSTLRGRLRPDNHPLLVRLRPALAGPDRQRFRPGRPRRRVAAAGLPRGRGEGRDRSLLRPSTTNRSTGDVVVYRLRVREIAPDRLAVQDGERQRRTIPAAAAGRAWHLQVVYFLERRPPDEWGYYSLSARRREHKLTDWRSTRPLASIAR